MWEIVSADRLQWSPGQRGKGVVFADGSIHTYPGEQEHMNYAGNPQSRPNFFFHIDPDGYVHDNEIGYNNKTGEDDQTVLNRVMGADPNLHHRPQSAEDFTLPGQMPGSPLDGSHGPDYNFIMHGKTATEASYVDELKQWLDDLDARPPVGPTPHHEPGANIAPEPPVSPSGDPSYWPPGHVPDWAEPVTAALREPESDPETTTGGWLRNNNELIERSLTPEQYEAALPQPRKERGLWLKRLLRRR